MQSIGQWKNDGEMHAFVNLEALNLAYCVNLKLSNLYKFPNVM